MNLWGEAKRWPPLGVPHLAPKRLLLDVHIILARRKIREVFYIWIFFSEKWMCENLCGEIYDVCCKNVLKKSTTGVTANVLGPSKPS